MLCLLFMLDQSLWKCLFSWLIKFHSFWGQLWWVLLRCEHGAVFCAGGLKHKNPSPLHWFPCALGELQWLNQWKPEAWEFLTFYNDGLLHWDQWIWFENSTAKNEETKNPKTNQNKKKTTKEGKNDTHTQNPREKLHCSTERLGDLILRPRGSILKEPVLHYTWNHSWPSPSPLLWRPSRVRQRWRGSTSGSGAVQAVDWSPLGVQRWWSGWPLRTPLIPRVQSRAILSWRAVFLFSFPHRSLC